MSIDWKEKEDLEQAKMFAEGVVNTMYDIYIIDDEKFDAAMKYAITTLADAVYARDESIRNSCREVISLSVSEAIKRAVL